MLNSSKNSSKYIMIHNHKHFLIDLNDYECIDKLGDGAFGFVCSVRNKKTKELFAAKICVDGYENLTSQKLINREIGILMRLRHPNIIKFIGYSLTDFDGQNNATILMQLAKNNTFFEYIRDTKLGSDNTTLQKILIGIARGMMYLHSKRIIHRDLKPENVLLDSDLNPLITDFGLAKIDDNKIHTKKRGTFIFMAPEVTNGNEYNGKADVFSFGILLFQALTQSDPYSELKLNDKDIAKKVAEENYRPIIPPDVKPSFRDLIEQCLDATPSKRPTFEQIFNKLAFNVDADSIYDDLFGNKEKKQCYYLDDVNEDEILAYADLLLKREINAESPSNTQIEELQKQITEMQNLFNEEIDRLTKENEKIKAKNKALTKDNKDLNDRIDKILKEFEGKPKSPTKKAGKNSKLSPKKNPQKHDDDDDDNDYKKEKKKNVDDYDDETDKSDNIEADDDDDDEDIWPHADELNGKEIKEIKYNPKFKLSGIFRALTVKSGGENIHDNETIEITTNSLQYSDKKYHPKVTVDPVNRKNKNKDYRSGDHGNAYVCFNFKGRKVQLSKYVIESSHKDNYTCNLRNWVIQGSNDGDNWVDLDVRNNNNQLNGKGRIVAFELNKPKNVFYKYICLRQTGKSWYQNNEHQRIGFCQIEFYGKIMPNHNFGPKKVLKKPHAGKQEYFSD